MNSAWIVNILVIALLIGFVYSGYREGFLRKAFGILSFFVVGFVSWYCSGPLSNMVMLYPKQEDALLQQLLYESLNRITLFVVLFLLLQCIVFLIRPITRLGNHVPVVSLFNRVGGSILGGIQAILILFLITMGLRLPMFSGGEEFIASSFLRYGDPLADTLLFYTKEPIAQLQKMEEVLQQSKAFSQEEANEIEAWLLESNIKKEDADKIMSMLRIEQ